MGDSPWSHKESDMTEQLHLLFFSLYLWDKSQLIMVDNLFKVLLDSSC